MRPMCPDQSATSIAMADHTYLYTYRSIPQKHDPVHQEGLSISFMLEEIKVNDISSWLYDVHTHTVLLLVVKKSNNKEIATRPLDSHG